MANPRSVALRSERKPGTSRPAGAPTSLPDRLLGGGPLGPRRARASSSSRGETESGGSRSRAPLFLAIGGREAGGWVVAVEDRARRTGSKARGGRSRRPRRARDQEPGDRSASPRTQRAPAPRGGADLPETIERGNRTTSRRAYEGARDEFRGRAPPEMKPSRSISPPSRRPLSASRRGPDASGRVESRLHATACSSTPSRSSAF